MNFITPPPSHLILVLLAVTMRPCVGADHRTKDHPATKFQYPVYSIPLRQDSSNSLLTELELDAKKRPWVIRLPKPFYYQEDVTAAQAAGVDSVFVVAGVNCSQDLRKVVTITGTDIDSLNKRGHPEIPGKPYAGNPPAPHWQGMNRIYSRHSAEGFLAPKEQLIDRLVTDNDFVLGKRLTHQQIAEPILRASEVVQKTALAGEKPPVFEFSGHQYKISYGKMGGLMAYVGPAANNPTLKNGWVGDGVQGSFFRDELFASKILIFEKVPGGERFEIDALTPHLIYRYGFYQGGDYRTKPQTVIDYFGLKPDPDFMDPCAKPQGNGSPKGLFEKP